MDAKTQVLDPNAKAVIDPTADDQVLDQGSKWRKGVTDLIGFWTGKNQCYTSGAFSATLREHRPDAMIFSAPGVGEFLRDLFYSGALPSFTVDDGQGGTMQVAPVQVSRTTEGLFPNRTPAGIEVIVYGPTFEACMDYEFEVFIPNPAKGEKMADAPAPAVGQTAMAAADKTGKTKTAVAIMGARLAAQTIVAKVWPDGRLCIPRNAFEAAVHLGGTPMRGGEPVFVRIGTDEVTVTLAATGDPAEKSYDLTTDKGRIAITANGKFTPGDAYKVSVAAGVVTVDIKTPC